MVIPKINSAHGSDTRNIINRVIDLINIQGKSIQDLVAKGQLTPTQYAALIQSVNGLISKGDVSVYDIDKNKGKFDSTFFTSDFLSDLNNGVINATEILPGSVQDEHIVNKTISPKKTNFLNRTMNLFDGEYLRFAMNYSPLTGNINYRSPTADGNPIGIIVGISPNQTYTITVHGEHDRFISGVTNEEPRFLGQGFTPVDLNVVNNDKINQYTFTNNSTGRFLLVYLSSSGQKPKVQVELGAEATPFSPAYEIDGVKVGIDRTVSLEDLDFVVKSDVNVFDGEYLKGALQVLSGNVPNFRVGSENENLAVVKVTPNQTYTVKVHEESKSNRFIIVGTEQYPVLGGWQVADYLFTQDNSLKQYTLDVPSSINYLLIYVSNEGGRPKMQVEKGAVATQYTPDIYIPSEYINLPLPSDNPVKVDDNSFTFYDELPKAYKRPENLVDSSTVIARSVTDTVYGWYDNLMNENEGYISKNLKGYGTNSNGAIDTTMPIYEYVFKPIFPDVDSSHLPRMLITSGVHGNEKLSVRSVYELMKQITDNSAGDNFANFFRYNLEIRVIPVVNPGGYDLNTRYNANGVNLNRNFKPNWKTTQEASGPEPLSENESKILDRWFSDYGQKSMAYIDSHNIAGVHNTSQGRYGFVWIISPDINMRTMSRNIFSTLSRQWLEEIDSFSAFPKNTMLADISDYNGGMAMEQAYDEHGIFSVVSDPERNGRYYYSHIIPDGLDLMKVNVDTLGALLLTIVKRFAS